MIRQPIHHKWRLLLGIVSVVALALMYTYLSYHQHQINPGDTTVPTWSQIGSGFTKIFEADVRGDRWITVDTIATLKRYAFGMLVGILGALIVGVHMGCFAWVESLLAPPLILAAKIPPTAALAVFFVLVGTDMNMYVAMIAVGVLPSLAQSIYLAIKEVPAQLIYKAYTLGASRTEVLFIICRLIAPKVIDAIRLQVGPALVYLIAAEMVVGHEGFGYRIRLQSKMLNMDVVYLYLMALALFGFAMDYSLNQLQRLTCQWYVKNGGSN